MSAQRESMTLAEKDRYPPAEPASFAEHARGRQFSVTGDDVGMVEADQNKLHRNLKGRHMQMIAIGGAIGAGLFVGTASAFQTGGPASVLIGFIIIGFMIYLMMQALAELAVMYPINGAFTMYIVRFMDPSWGFACGWEYAFSWLVILPFEISAACNIIRYWPAAENINACAWIIPLLAALTAIQFFGVRGYGEVEFVLSVMKIVACLGFLILGIIIDCGGVPTDNRGYIGVTYWKEPYSAFLNGFHGFCTVFVTASFAFSGTELTGLAAAEADNPRKEIPKASKQVVWRICIFYIVNLFLVGLIVPANSDLYNESGTRHSPFVIAIQLAGIPALPSIFNAVILISVISVANSCTFASTRTLQALASEGMGPKIFAYVDKKGRPVVVTLLQLLFGCLAFLNLDQEGGQNIFYWLLSFSGLIPFFVFGSIAICHIRFRSAWKHNGHSLDEIPFRAAFGVTGSYICAVMNFVCLAAQFYVALYPVGPESGYLDPTTFFQSYLAGPFIVVLYAGWKIYSWFFRPEHRPFFIALKDIDIYTGLRDEQKDLISGPHVTDVERRQSIIELNHEKKRTPKDWIMASVRSVI